MAAAIFCGAVRNARARNHRRIRRKIAVRAVCRALHREGGDLRLHERAGGHGLSRALRTAVLTCSLAILTAFDIGMFLSV